MAWFGLYESNAAQLGVGRVLRLVIQGSGVTC